MNDSILSRLNPQQGPLLLPPQPSGETGNEKGILAAKVESLRNFIDSYGLGLIAEEEGLKDQGSTEEGATEEGATDEVLTEEEDFTIMKKMEQEAKNDLSVPIDEQQVEEN